MSEYEIGRSGDTVARKLPDDPVKRRLTDSIVLEMRRSYASGFTSQDEIAKRFGIAQTTVGQIVRGETWKHLNDIVPPKDSGTKKKCAPDCACLRHQNLGTGRPGFWNGTKATGESLTRTGYRFLTMEYDHPLATTGSVVMEHRKVLFDTIGPGPHECHWNETYGCGRISLEWGGLQGDSLCVDHLDHDRTNNAPENLVPSCIACNLRRGRERKVM